MTILLLLNISIVLFIYWLLIPIQKTISPTNHYESYNCIFARNKKKAWIALLIRMLICLATCVLAYVKFKFNLYFTIGLLTFAQLVVDVPNFVNFKLYFFTKDKKTFVSFIQFILSILITTFSCIIWCYFLRILEVQACQPKHIIYIATSFVLLLSSQIVGNILTNKSFFTYTYDDKNCIGFNLFLTNRYISFYKDYFDKKYGKYISQSAKKWDVPYESIRTILLLETYNRPYTYTKIYEYIVCKLFPKLAIKFNMSLGLSQISINKARELTGLENKTIIKKILDNDFNIDVCAHELKNIANSYFEKYGRNGSYFLSDQELDLLKNEIASLQPHQFFARFLASRYMTAVDWSKITSVQIYSAVLERNNINGYLKEGQKFPRLRNPHDSNIIIHKENYRNWKIFYSKYNLHKAWPKDEFPNAESEYYVVLGCFSCAIAIMMRKYNVITSNKDEDFNPWIFHLKCRDNNLYDKAANLDYVQLDKIYPIKAVATIPYTLNKLKSNHKKYMCLIQVKGYHQQHHYLVLDKIVDNTVYVLDDYSYWSTLDEFDEVYQIVLFEKLN